MKLGKRVRAWLTLGIGVLLAACGGGGSDESPAPGGGTTPTSTVASVVVSPGSATLELDGTTRLVAEARDASGQVLSDVVFIWTSSDPSVATVDGGVVTARASGSAIVTASVGTVRSPGVALTVRQPPVAGSSSDALIEAARAAGTIDDETALKYRVFAAFRDPRLPDAYRGSGEDTLEGLVGSEVAERFDQLSEATQLELLPYFERPANQGSWLDPAVRAQSAQERQQALRARLDRKRLLASRQACKPVIDGWTALDGTHAKVRVWYDTKIDAHFPVAGKVVQYLDQDIWPRLIDALGFQPPSDDTHATLCDGGNGRLDIYLVDPSRMTNRGETYEDFFALYTSPVYIALRADLPDEQLKHTVSHEFMHAVHWSYRTRSTQKSYGWFRDALANWATDEVYPGNTSLNRMASCHFKSPHLALEDQATGYCATASGAARNYGAYLPLRYLSKTLGSTVVRDILAATTTYSTANEAMDRTVTGGLKKQWPLFGRTLWNQGAVPALYRPQTFTDWDVLGAGTPVTEPVLAPDLPAKTVADLGGAVEIETALDTRLANLSNKYYHFTFGDVPTRSVMFHNTFYDNFKNGQKVGVRAFYKVPGQPWQEEDWTEYEWIGFCRDVKLQRLEELVVIFSSAEWSGTSPVVVAARPPRLMRNNVGCWGFKGTTRRTYSSDSWSSGSIKLTYDAVFDYHPSGFPTQYTDPTSGRLRVPIAAPLFTSGQWTLVEAYSESGCTYNLNSGGSSSSIVLGGDAHGNLMINVFNESLPPSVRAEQEAVLGTRPRVYFIEGASTKKTTGTVSGPEPDCGPPWTYESGVGGWVVTNDDQSTKPVVAGDGRLAGRFVASGSGERTVYEWDLTPQREP